MNFRNDASATRSPKDTFYSIMKHKISIQCGFPFNDRNGVKPALDRYFDVIHKIK